jgi:hypothetical protein
LGEKSPKLVALLTASVHLATASAAASSASEIFEAQLLKNRRRIEIVFADVSSVRLTPM